LEHLVLSCDGKKVVLVALCCLLLFSFARHGKLIGEYILKSALIASGFRLISVSSRVAGHDPALLGGG
jgi:hypothetical protein